MDLIDYGRFVAALLFVLGLIALTAWLARRFRLGPGGPAGAARRMAVLETLPLDARRNLLLLSPEGNRLLEGGIADQCKAPRSDRREAFG